MIVSPRSIRKQRNVLSEWPKNQNPKEIFLFSNLNDFKVCVKPNYNDRSYLIFILIVIVHWRWQVSWDNSGVKIIGCIVWRWWVAWRILVNDQWCYKPIIILSCCISDTSYLIWSLCLDHPPCRHLAFSFAAHRERMGVLKNEVPKWIAVFIWAGIQAGLFGYYFWVYYTFSEYEYTRNILRIALAFARAPANCLNFNCMLILLPVCRNLISFIRRYLCKCCLRSLRRLLDENISFHKLSAYAICFWTTMHTIAHCYNVEQYVQAQTAAPASVVGSVEVTVYQLSALGAGQCPVDHSPSGDQWVNPVCEKDSHSVLEVFKIYPALSGVIITLALIIIVFSATEFIRRSYFEIFWFTHHLFVVFFAFLVSHGFRGVVRSQKNLDIHDFKNCSSVEFNNWGQDPNCRELPTFESNTPSTWCWVIVPMVLYTIERIIRVYRSFQKVIITKVSLMSNSVSISSTFTMCNVS